MSSCECGNESTGSIKCGEFLDLLSRLISFSRSNLLYGVNWLAGWLVGWLVGQLVSSLVG